MTTSRSSQIPVTNLKERIAALEQRNAENTTSIQRATSPTPSITSNGSHSGPPNGALRDRIARFEKKGGVPVPRGRFGLGAPPSVEGPRKRGELYGNRIPVPTRILSGGNFPLSRPGSTSYDQRRSFSASSVMSDFDNDRLDFSPITSPTTTVSPDSPVSIASVSDISPSSPDFSHPRQNVTRATSFALALEVARKAEIEKQERENSIHSTSRTRSESDGHLETPTETAPTIVVSSEDVSPVITPEPTIVTAASASSIPEDSLPLEKVQPNEELSYKPPSETVIPNGASPVIVATTHNPVAARETMRVGTPPLNIRKRIPTDPSIPPVVDKAAKEPDTNIVLIESQVPVSPIPQMAESHDVPTWISDVHKKETADSLSTLQPNLVEVDEPVPSESIELKLDAPEVSPTLPSPDIIIRNEQPQENIQELDGTEDDPFINSNAGVRSRKLALTLDSEKLDDEALTSPPLQTASFSSSLSANAITSPDSYLSPPDTGLQFGSSLSSGSFLSPLGSRPMSMIETSPKVVTQILRMTPATGRGVPVFLPGHAPARKSDFVYFPPTPEDEDADLGSATQPSHPNRTRSGSDPEDIRNMPSKQTFSAVVHRKVRETPASAPALDNKPRLSPQTPQARRVQRATILETPLSPGHGELAALLHEAVLLEDTLNKGELPSEETQLDEENRQKEEKAKEVVAAEAQAKAKTEEDEQSRLALAAAQLQSKRDEPTAGRLKHTFLVPLSKARSRHRKELYTAKAESFLSRSEELPAFPNHSESADLPTQPTATQLPTKSPKFSSLRKFSSVSRGAGGGALARTSYSISSEVSSEESSLAATLDEFGRGTGSTLSFPSVSPKKASSTLARATSFAEKLFSRGRTKSGGSTLSSTSEVIDAGSLGKISAPRIPAIVSPTSLDFPTLPGHPEVPPLSLDKPDQIIPLRRSTSSKRSAVYFPPGSDLTAVPQLPSVIPGFEITSSQTSSTSLLPSSSEAIRPSSAKSVSSVGSLPSPLFNQELVDAFPSVPATTPSTSINFHNREISLATPSFDTTLLSSAIHLASTYRMATPKASSIPLPSERAATPTPTSTGEIVL